MVLTGAKAIRDVDSVFHCCGFGEERGGVSSFVRQEQVCRFLHSGCAFPSTALGTKNDKLGVFLAECTERSAGSAAELVFQTGGVWAREALVCRRDRIRQVGWRVAGVCGADVCGCGCCAGAG